MHTRAAVLLVLAFGKLAWTRSGARQVSGHEILDAGGTVSSTVTLSSDGKHITQQQHTDGKDGAYDQTLIWDKT